MANSDMLVRVMADTKNYDANLSKASKTLKQFADNNLSMSGVLKQTTSALTGMAAQVLSVAAAIGAAKKVVGDMVRINMQFEQGTANLASIIGKSREEISALTTQAKQLGATTRYTAMQITELQTNLARLGFTEKEILNSTSAVQAFATATGADLGEAANLAGAALRGFGMNATEMERVASVLSVSTTKSALSFEKLATAVPIVAPVAKQFGFTIEDTVTLLAKLSDAGMDASSAATATRNIFLNMAKDSGKLAQAMGRPVHSVEEFGEALKEMRDKGMSLNDILSMVGVRSTAAFAVFADNAETLKDFKDSITDCGDAMHDMENKQIDTLQGSITILNSSWEGLMLSFSESNGVIKTVVDSLSELLQTWTKWRNRNAGGDAAIKTYEMADSEVAKYGKQYIEGDRAAGMSDSAIKRNTEEENEKFKEQKKILEDLLREYEEFEDYRKSRSWTPEELHDRLVSTNENLKKHGYSLAYGQYEKLQKDIAKKNDAIAINDYVISALTPASTGSQTGGGSQAGGGSDTAGVGAQSKSRLATLKAQYEEQEKLHIASLDRMHMKEEDYEASVYKIKRETLQKIADLYQDETAEKARANAAISQLDIAYQGTQMRLANKGSKSTKTYETQTGPSGYSEEGISALRSEIQSRQKPMQMGSSEYIVEADRLVDLASFENLLKTATQNGVQIDPSILEDKFEKIDLGVDISDEEWQTLVDNINTQLTDLGLEPIKLNFDTGAVEEAKKKVEETKSSIEAMKETVGSISSVVDSINNLKSVGEELTSVFSGEKDAWDSFMTVISSGISIMQTLISITEALSAVEKTKAATSGAAAAANAAEGSTEAGKAVAGIPVVGPILAAAAIAAVLAAMIAAISSSKSAKSGFASGGIIPGNSFSGDNMRGLLPNGEIVGLDAGEVILNRAQQGVIANDLKGQQQEIRVVGMIAGSDLYLVNANYAKEQGLIGAASGAAGGAFVKIQ